MNKVHYTNCPVCSSGDIKLVLTVKDYSVSKEDFEVWQCKNCDLRFTQDVPDESSIGSYYQSEDYISHSNTSKGFINKLYQKVRRHTLNQKAKLIIAYTKDGGKILDVGAGIGAFLNTMKERKWEVTGIEPDEGARQQAKDVFNLQLLQTNVLEQLPENNFDAITLWHVLEHVHQLHYYVEQVKKLLEQKGKIFIAVPNYKSLDASVYKMNWAAYDVPRHLYHFTPKAVSTLMKKHGLKVIEQKPMWFDSFYISLLSSKYKNQKTNWFGAVINGLRSNIKTLFNKKYGSSLIYIVEKN